MKAQGHEVLSVDDVCNEIFDMVRPQTEERITFEDLIAWYDIRCLNLLDLSFDLCFSGQAETVINILIDITGFWAYENRELQLIDAKDVKDEPPKTDPPPHTSEPPPHPSEAQAIESETIKL